MSIGSRVPTAMVMLIAAAGMVRILMAHWREGAVLLGGALLVAAVLRMVLPVDRVGLLAVRSRMLDILAYTALGGATILLALTVTRSQLTL